MKRKLENIISFFTILALRNEISLKISDQNIFQSANRYYTVIPLLQKTVVCNHELDTLGFVPALNPAFCHISNGKRSSQMTLPFQLALVFFGEQKTYQQVLSVLQIKYIVHCSNDKIL